MAYNWQQKDWKNFRYDASLLEAQWTKFLLMTGEGLGFLKSSDEQIQQDALINLLVNEAIKTSAIEGEYISRIDLISSIRKNLGLITHHTNIKDKRSVGIAQLLMDVRENFDKELTEEDLLAWHRLLMMGNTTLEAGKWRTHPEPMQVVSGAMGREIVHFEAPPSEHVPAEMNDFIVWFNSSGNIIPNALIRVGITHLYFESIHPFEDGNGRIGRVLAEKALAQGIQNLC